MCWNPEMITIRDEGGIQGILGKVVEGSGR